MKDCMWSALSGAAAYAALSTHLSIDLPFFQRADFVPMKGSIFIEPPEWSTKKEKTKCKNKNDELGGGLPFPVAPHVKGCTSYASNITAEERQKTYAYPPKTLNK